MNEWDVYEAEEGLCVASDRNRKWTGSFWQPEAGFRADQRFAEWATADWQCLCGGLLGIIVSRNPHSVARGGTGQRAKSHTLTHTSTSKWYSRLLLPPRGPSHIWLTMCRCVCTHVWTGCTSQCRTINLYHLKVEKLSLMDLSFIWAYGAQTGGHILLILFSED